MKLLPLLCLAFGLAACQQQPLAPVSATEPEQAFAQASCGSCHAVARHGTSPNSNAPPFAVIVNQEGLTRETLSTWLRDAHNYPREMDLHLDPAEVDGLVAYMLTLKDPNYRPPT